MASSVIVWFRHELRTADNPALSEAVALARSAGKGMLCVYLADDSAALSGEVARWWLRENLRSLKTGLEACGLDLAILRGAPHVVLPALVQEVGATHFFLNRRYDPAGRDTDRIMEDVLKDQGVKLVYGKASLLFEPEEVRTKSGHSFRMFTPFWKACLAKTADTPLKEVLDAPRFEGKRMQVSDALSPEEAFPHIRDGGWTGTFAPGEAAARERLKTFVKKDLEAYPALRDRPDLPATSLLSPYLAIGALGPGQVWKEVCNSGSLAAEVFLRQLGWREFGAHLLFHFPRLPDTPMKPEFGRWFAWQRNKADLAAWKEGRTGYPLIDAAMRCLKETGWMHNRLRMITGSFLIKDLMVSWTEGRQWFEERLIDIDPANNAMGWQWVCGCGADGAPYFRVFNPVRQGERFDGKGVFTRQWVPELAAMPDRFLHRPWEASPDLLKAAGVVLGRTYPKPVIDHGAARARALEAYAEMRALKEEARSLEED